MAITEAFTGSPTVGTTEYSVVNGSTTLTASTAAGVYQLFADLAAMAAGDEFQIRIYEKVQSGGTQRVVYQSNLVGVSPAPAWASPSLLLLNGWEMSLKKIAGTDRAIPYSCRKVA